MQNFACSLGQSPTWSCFSSLRVSFRNSAVTTHNSWPGETKEYFGTENESDAQCVKVALLSLSTSHYPRSLGLDKPETWSFKGEISIVSPDVNFNLFCIDSNVCNSDMLCAGFFQICCHHVDIEISPLKTFSDITIRNNYFSNVCTESQILFEYCATEFTFKWVRVINLLSPSVFFK